ncbi:MAG: UDP-N-acetylmuramoyl-L-alanyl-D-glutamate--2,6-diaminopimelate ligase, partial [Nitrospirae bacterium]|nr:UDP-N-acetylmuramoyl-L-alanyl-D-glutamate--2,6-diaminopimelate ligase [Nitrospirota bacterium]
MILRELLSSIKIERIIGAADKDIEGIAYDSRLIKKGSLFVAVRGYCTDGHIYIKDAVSRGAAAVVVEKGLDLIGDESFQGDITFIEVFDSREALACLSSAFYGEPSKTLPLIGITGTNGKTTTTYITKSILESWGRKVGL